MKAVCLGAKAVGLGRPFLYAQSVGSALLLKLSVLFDWYHIFQAYGVDGVSKTIEILKREIITAMRLAGASTLSDLQPEMV